MQQLVDNRYRLVKSLGSGGMADVYLAHDDILDRDVALKVMSSRYASDEEFVERFKREAQSAAALSHPNIVSIFDRGESEDGTYYIAMEYLPGGTLKNRIVKRGALPARTAAAVALQMAEALRAAHERDVIHRDIKPHNILITGLGGRKGHGLRHSPGGGVFDHDEDGPHPGYGPLHLARAGDGRACRSGERPLLAGRRPLRDAHRRTSLRR